MSNSSRPSPCPVFYIGDRVAPRSLRRAQDYTNVITNPPPPLPPSSSHGGGGGHRSAPPPHPFRLVLDGLAAARAGRAREALAEQRRTNGGTRDAHHATTGDDDTNDNGNGNVSHTVSSGDVSGLAGAHVHPRRALADLQWAYGCYEGSALHRDWVERPASHLALVARDLGRAVIAMLPPGTLRLSCSSGDGGGGAVAADDDDDGLDVHVQLCPSASLPSIATAFCAVVTLRHRRPLSLMEAEQTALEARLLAAAAGGQTVESSLRFWREVAYEGSNDGGGGENGSGGGDLGLAVTAAAARALREAGLDGFPALGLTPLLQVGGGGAGAEAAAATTCPAADTADGDSDPDAPSRRRPRTDSGNGAGKDAGKASTTAVVVPGTWPSVSQQFLAIIGEARGNSSSSSYVARELRRALFDDRQQQQPTSASPRWFQPDALLSHGGDSSGGGGAAPGRGLRRHRTSVAPAAVRIGTCGLAAVVYVTLEGMAYVAYPPPPRAAEAAAGPASAAALPSLPPPSPPTPSSRVPFHRFPLESKDSFARSLLGL